MSGLAIPDLQMLVDDGIYCTELHISVDVAGEQDDFLYRSHLGVDRGSDTLFNVWCAGRPFISALVGVLSDAGKIDLDRPVREYLPDWPHQKFDYSTADVLNHSAPLAAPSIAEVNLYPVSQRAALLEKGLGLCSAGYSDYASVVLLKRLIESVTGSPAIEVFADEVLKPLGVERSVRFGFDRDGLLSEAHRIGCYLVGLPIESVPLLHDRSPLVACAEQVCGAAYVSAHALCKVYSALGAALAGLPVLGAPRPETMVKLLSMRGPALLPPDNPNRSGAWSGGFMVQLGDHGYGRHLSQDSFGHSGLLGASFGYHDPLTRVSVAVIMNGLQFDSLAIDFVRQRIIAAIDKTVIKMERLG